MAARNACDLAATEAAAEFDIPSDILLAITRVETGRGPDQTPWPWTINRAGDSGWFDTPDAAVAAAEDALALGSDNLDIGCFQLNYRWHGAAFPSVAAMFDPQDNARYAASFLSDLFAQEADWPRAVAAYHSRTPENADRYLARIEAVLAKLSGLSFTPDLSSPDLDSADLNPPDEPERQNQFPLLQAGARGSQGSLVPLLLARSPLIGAP